VNHIEFSINIQLWWNASDRIIMYLAGVEKGRIHQGRFNSMAIIHPVGQPESEAERQTIRLLKEHLSEDYIVFHNLETVSPAGFAYEIDLLVIAPHAIYVIEEKNYTGHIRGNVREWVMFNGAVFPSPIPAINRKTRIVATQLKKHDPALADVFCQGVVHLSSAKAKIKIHDPQADRVTVADELITYLSDPKRLPQPSCRIAGRRDLICGAVFAGFEPSQPHREIGAYRVLEKLGETPEFSEYLAEHRYVKIEPRTRLKVYHFDMYEEVEKRDKQLELIFRDVNALKMLAGHPNIARTSDIFPWENDSFVLPTEWVDGYSLRGLIDTAGKSLSFSNKVDIFRQLCAGLDYAHQRGVLHRDLRPDNIVVCADGRVKITNFDFARIADVRVQTIADQIDGHLDLRYTAPEVLVSVANASIRSDLYSLGIIIFETMCCRLPYTTPRELLRNREFGWHLADDVDGPVQEMNRIIGRLCAFNPESRYTSAAEVSALLGCLPIT